MHAKISCREVWKIFGPEPKRFFERHGEAPSLEDFRRSGHIPGVRDATFDVNEGEILVVMGLSGSGKSTLVRCLTRLVEPTSGQILIDGVDLLGASPREMIELRRHKMGMVFQHFALLPHRTVLHNVAFPLEVQGMDTARRLSRAREVIEMVGLKGREGYYPRELSGGQQQRVGIARSLAVGPEVWFLDEPFSALDPLIRREMQDEFLRLQSMLNKTIVFITHDFDEAIRLADRIVIMNEGVLVQIGTAEQLITRPANDYVREFTRDVPREKLLSVASVMGPVASDVQSGVSVSSRDRIAVAAPLVLNAHGPVRVVDGAGEVVGAIRRQDIVDVMFGSEESRT